MNYIAKKAFPGSICQEMLAFSGILCYNKLDLLSHIAVD